MTASRSISNDQLLQELQIIKDTLKANGASDTYVEAFQMAAGILELDPKSCGDLVMDEEYKSGFATPEEIEKARDLFQIDGEVEIDDGAEASRSDSGAFIAAWVWISKED